MRRVMLGLLLLAACTNRMAEREAQAGAFVGRSEEDLVREAGVPTRTVEAGGKRFVVYSERRVDAVPVSGPGPYFLGRPYYYGGAYPATAVETVCDTNFEILAGRVSAVTFKGNGC